MFHITLTCISCFPVRARGIVAAGYAPLAWITNGKLAPAVARQLLVEPAFTVNVLAALTRLFLSALILASALVQIFYVKKSSCHLILDVGMYWQNRQLKKETISSRSQLLKNKKTVVASNDLLFVDSVFP